MKFVIHKNRSGDIEINNHPLIIFFSNKSSQIFRLLRNVHFDVVVASNPMFLSLNADNKYEVYNYNDLKNIDYRDINLIDLSGLTCRHQISSNIIFDIYKKSKILILVMRESKKPYKISCLSESSILQSISYKYRVVKLSNGFKLRDIDETNDILEMQISGVEIK